MAVYSKPRRQRRASLMICSVLAVLAALGIGMLLWRAVALSSLAAVAQRVSEVQPLLTALRLGLITMLAVLWPRLVRWSCSAASTPQHAAHLDKLRWRVIGWLLLIELVIGHNLPGKIAAAFGAGS
tara:strand:+ start:5130 stop:5507 length:378 start_codon:yes stop_codon:yes gene_type:complete